MLFLLKLRWETHLNVFFKEDIFKRRMKEQVSEKPHYMRQRAEHRGPDAHSPASLLQTSDRIW